LINPNKLYNKNQNNCSFLRRLCAIFYDTILLTSVFFFATFALIPFLEGSVIDSSNFIYKIYLFIVTYLYFTWQWYFGGKTLGMRSWQIKIINEAGIKPSLRQATIRFLASTLSFILVGGGFLWAIFDKNKKTLHDHLSKTMLIIEKK